MEKIKVLHFELDENSGGIETFLLNLYSNISLEQYHFDFITRSNNPAKKKELEKYGCCNIYKVSSFNNILKYILDIKKIIIENKYDIIHIHKNSCANIIPFFLAKIYSSATIICHSHNTKPSTGNLSKVLHLLNRGICYRLSDLHLACSNVAGEWMYGKKEYQVIKNGIKVDDFLFDSTVMSIYRKKLNINDSADVFINVGRFTKQKNHERIIEIFKEYLNKNYNSFLLLVGDGIQKDHIKDLVERENIANKVIFLQNRNDVNKLLMSADYFLMPSFYEGLPFVAIEAQAAGLELIIADTVSKEIEITKNVYWFSLNDSDNKIVNDIINIKKTNRILAYQDVKNSMFNIEYTVKQIEKIYQKSVERMKKCKTK